MGMGSAVPPCVNRNLSLILNRPSNDSVPQGIGEVCLFAVIFKEIVGQLESWAGRMAGGLHLGERVMWMV